MRLIEIKWLAQGPQQELEIGIEIRSFGAKAHAYNH